MHKSPNKATAAIYFPYITHGRNLQIMAALQNQITFPNVCQKGESFQIDG